MIIFDIETTALPLHELNELMPEFNAPGNLKDPAKIIAAIEEKKADWIERAALAPETGKVLAVGIMDNSETLVVLSGLETQILHDFWEWLDSRRAQHWAGWFIFGFDLPFLIRRSWMNSIPVPSWIKEGRYFDKTFVDLMEVYTCGQRDSVSLDTAARALKVGKKNGKGADFGRLWNGSEAEHVQALEYLRNDMDLTRKIAAIIRP